MKMPYKKIVKRLFVEIYNFQSDNEGEGNSAAFTALLYLSMFQFLNTLSIFMIIDNIIKIDLANFFGHHLIIGMIIPTAILVSDYFIVKPVPETIKEYDSTKRKITWIYILLTLLILGGCVAWIVFLNNAKGG